MAITPDQFKLQDLANKWLKGTITADEQDEFNHWFKSGNEVPFEITGDEPMSDEKHRLKIFTVIQELIDRDEQVKVKESPLKFQKTKSVWKYAKIAASIAIILGTAIYFIDDTPHKLSHNIESKNDAIPGKIGATLTLGNGKTVKLSDAANGVLVNESGISISKTSDGQIVYVLHDLSSNEQNKASQKNKLSTTNGETYSIILPDKSKVWLNATSSLTYSTVLNEDGYRIVELKGEAYFEIHKDKKHPFIVKTNNQEVEVLGTHFNINAYDNEPMVRTTLLEGSVKIKPSNKNKASVILQPNQLARLSNNDDLKITDIDAEDSVDWKNDLFIFKDENLTSVMRRIARWYNVKIDYKTKNIDHVNFNGTLSRFDNVSKILTKLQATCNLQFKIKDGVIQIID